MPSPRGHWRARLAAWAGLLLLAVAAPAQPPAYKAPRTADGKPNLNGIWQAMNTANWDVQPHSRTRPGCSWQSWRGGLGARGDGHRRGRRDPVSPRGPRAKKKANFETTGLALDPETKCYLPGVPRATYMPFPFQIIQCKKTS